MTRRDLFALHAPIDFKTACVAFGDPNPSLTMDGDRAAFFAVWALLRREWADQMLAELDESRKYGVLSGSLNPVDRNRKRTNLDFPL